MSVRPEPTSHAMPAQTTTPHSHHGTTAGTHQLAGPRMPYVEKFRKIKGGLQLVAMLSSLVGFSLVVWIVAHDPPQGFYFDYPSIWSVWQSALTLGISFIWCAACVIFLLIKKKSIHPGLRVALDLLLWIGIIGCFVLALFSYWRFSNWGQSGRIEANWDSFYGSYHQSSNGTWTWQWDRDSPNTATESVRTCEKYDGRSSTYELFATCAEEDIFLNKLWQDKSTPLHTRFTALVFGFISALCHFVLFIWACIDCHKHNKSKKKYDSEALAADIVQTMVKNGAIVPTSAHSTHWGQDGYYQMSPHTAPVAPQR